MENNKKLSKPRFSIIMFLVAFTADTFIAGIILLVTLILPPVGWMLGFFVSVFVGGIFWLWLFFKSNFPIKKTARSFVKLLPAVGVNILPFFRFIIFEWVILFFAEYISEWITYLRKKKDQKNRVDSLEAVEVLG